MIKITIIIPIYNMEKYLSTCLDSILSQTLKEIEILCINDGSTDQSEAIVKNYMKKHTVIKLINQANQGVSSARNRGIELAKGQYIAFMDPDDYYLLENTLEQLYDNAIKHQVKICGGSFSEDHGEWIRKEFIGIYTKYTFETNKMIEYKDYQFDYGYHRFIYSRKMLLENQIFFPRYIRFQDPPFFVRAMITAKQFYALSMPTYCYRYGHQKLNWDEKRVSDVICGFIDDLKMSKENNLNDLHHLTVWRLVVEYEKPIVMNLDSIKVLELLLEANSVIDKKCICDDPVLQKGVASLIKNYIDELSFEIKKTEQRVEEVYRSNSYRFGSKMLFVPKKIKEYFNKWKV